MDDISGQARRASVDGSSAAGGAVTTQRTPLQGAGTTTSRTGGPAPTATDPSGAAAAPTFSPSAGEPHALLTAPKAISVAVAAQHPDADEFARMHSPPPRPPSVGSGGGSDCGPGHWQGNFGASAAVAKAAYGVAGSPSQRGHATDFGSPRAGAARSAAAAAFAHATDTSGGGARGAALGSPPTLSAPSAGLLPLDEASYRLALPPTAPDSYRK